MVQILETKKVTATRNRRQLVSEAVKKTDEIEISDDDRDSIIYEALAEDFFIENEDKSKDEIKNTEDEVSNSSTEALHGQSPVDPEFETEHNSSVESDRDPDSPVSVQNANSPAQLESVNGGRNDDAQLNQSSNNEKKLRQKARGATKTVPLENDLNFSPDEISTGEESNSDKEFQPSKKKKKSSLSTKKRIRKPYVKRVVFTGNLVRFFNHSHE